MIEKPITIEFSYLIAAIAFVSSFLLYRSGRAYKNAATFMLLFGVASGLGGVFHHIEYFRMAETNAMVNGINQHLPGFMRPINLQGVMTRLWFTVVIVVGLMEYYLVYLLFEPLSTEIRWVGRYQTTALLLYCIAQMVFNQYPLVVTFHLVTHVVISFILIRLYQKHRQKPFLWMLYAVVFNLLAGLVQQAMANHLLPSGPVNHNDWYHIAICVFLLYLHWLFTRGGLIKVLSSSAASI